MKSINEEKIKFILNLKRKGIRDTKVLRAMETIDRKKLPNIPANVLFGLIFVSFGPLKILPKI